MPAALPVVRAAVPADAEPVAAIFAHYVATSVATFEEVAPTAADWRQRLDDLAARNLPFLVAEAEEDGSVCGFAYASPWRPKPAFGTLSRTRCTSPPARPAAGSAAPCSAGCWPGALTPARGRSSRSSPIPAATVGGAAPPVRLLAGGPPFRRRPQARPLDRHRADAKGPGTGPLSTAFTAGEQHWHTRLGT